MTWCLPLLLFASACRDAPQPADSPEALHEQIVRLYERARQSGEDVSEDVYEWARGDLERIGDWEYRVVERGPESAEALEEALDALGAERWQLVWMERRGEVLRLVLKRPSRSYLRHVPLSELPRLIPGVGE